MGKTITQLVIDNIVSHTEFLLLDTFHKELFKKKLSIKYINYTLDIYNSCKYMGKIVATKYSLVETIETMMDDHVYMKKTKEDINEY